MPSWNECLSPFQTCRCVCVDSQKVGRRLRAAFRKLFGHSWEEGSTSFSQAMNFPALVMPSCESGATSPASLIAAKTKKDPWRDANRADSQNHLQKTQVSEKKKYNRQKIRRQSTDRTMKPPRG